MAMKGSSSRRLLGDYLRIDDQAAGDVLVEHQNRVDRQKRLRHDEAAVGAVVERALHPLRGVRLRRVAARFIAKRARLQIRSARIGFRL